MAYKSSGRVDCSIEPDTSKLKGRTAIVTGGASGIGLAYVRGLINAGAYVVIADIDEEGGKKVESEVGKNSAFVKCNVLTWSDQLAAFKKAIELSPDKQIDIVVANAGISGNDTIAVNDAEADEPEEPKLLTLDINTTGVFYTTKLALFYFKKQQAQLDGGRKRDRNLVLQASLAGYLDLPAPQYGASKFAVRGLMRALRRTEASSGVRVNLIAPWYINTPILSPDFAALLESVQAGWATTEDCARALLRIVSDTTINGRALGIVPRGLEGATKGYMDVDQDDFDEGTAMRMMQDTVMRPMDAILAQAGKAGLA